MPEKLSLRECRGGGGWLVRLGQGMVAEAGRAWGPKPGMVAEAEDGGRSRGWWLKPGG